MSERRFGMKEARAWADIYHALEFMRNCGDRPGMYESAEQALKALDVLCPEPAPLAALPAPSRLRGKENKHG